MKRKKTESYDANVLWNRLGITDQELAFLLSCGLPTARKIALEANAVFRVGKRKLNNVPRIKAYVDSISGE